MREKARVPICVVDYGRMKGNSLQAHPNDDGSLTIYRFRGELLPGFEPICSPVCLSFYVIQWARGEPIPKELL